jgi:cytochrome oxidase Cu insertion factor (SCO1/SenC/PrrC family)
MPEAKAQPALATLVEMEGRSVDGERIGLRALRGRVVLVFYWSTNCPVCLDKMHEMRANLAGWMNKPFSLLGVNMDKRREDLAGYESLLRQTVPASQRLRSVWAGDPAFTDNQGPPNHLPSGALIDKGGQLVERYSGRIPPEAWDRIAELL